MKIVELQSENVKRLKAVNIKPDGSLVVIKGNNGQGKTSVLDSIQLALGGGRAQPPKVIRDGEDGAQVVVDLGEIVVTRRWTSNEKSHLEVRSKEGAKYGSPQAMLDKLVGTLSFDPLAFMRLEPKKQVETLRALVGLDFSAIESRRGALYEERTIANRELARMKALHDGMPKVAPAEAVDLEDLLAEQEMLLETQKDNESVRSALRSAEEQLRHAAAAVSAAQERVNKLEDELAAARGALTKAEDHKVSRLELTVLHGASAKKLVDPDLNAIRERIKNAQATNEAARRVEERKLLGIQLAKAEKDAEGLSVQIAKLDGEKGRLLAEAKFPVSGLSFSAEGIALNGIPLEQASGAEQLRVSLGMGLALNPKLRVLLIRDGSLLDEKSLTMVAKMAEDAGAQVWIERVGASGDVGVLIEDGQVVGVEPDGPSDEELAAQRDADLYEKAQVEKLAARKNGDHP